MTIKECYEACGANYEEVLGRLRSERLVTKFAGKFLADPSFNLLETSLAEKNFDEAFRAAHTLKGVCQNLALTKLYVSSERMAEVLRPGREAERDGVDLDALFKQVAEDYTQTTEALGKLDA